MPSHLKIGGLNYKVFYPYLFKTNPALLGLHEGDQQRIKISHLFLNQPRIWPKIVESFIHEVIHAIDHVYCAAIMKEGEVFIMSNWIYTIIRDNDFSIKSNKIPDKLKIGGFTYDVIDHHEFQDNENDACSADNEYLKIWMTDNDRYGKPYGPGIKMTNFLFLIVCSICEMSGMYLGFEYGENIGDMSKQDTFVNGLYQVVCDNNLEKLIKSDAELK